MVFVMWTSKAGELKVDSPSSRSSCLVSSQYFPLRQDYLSHVPKVKAPSVTDEMTGVGVDQDDIALAEMPPESTLTSTTHPNVNSRREEDGYSSGPILERDESLVEPQIRFSAMYICMLTLAPLISFGALGFLAFLWAESHRARNSLPVQQSWYGLVDRGWILRAITLSALALRTTTDMVAGIATSMLAALFLEVSGVRLSRLADVSVLRSADSPPYVLAWRALRDILTPPLHAGRYLLTLLLVTTLVLQLSSTILLFDLNETTIPRAVMTAGDLIRFSYSGISGPLRYINGKQAMYLSYTANFPRFAEHSQPPLEPALGQERDFRDTGVVYRSFMPLPKASREQLRQFAGPATVLESQVVCVRPNISSFAVSSPQIPFHPTIRYANLTFSADVASSPSLGSIRMFTSSFLARATKPRNITMPVARPSVPFSDDDDDDAPLPGRDQQWAMSISLTDFRETSAFMLFNWTGPGRGWTSEELASQDSWVQSPKEEWTTLTHTIVQDVSVDMTLCLTWYNSSLFNIETGVGKAFLEPQVSWDNVSGILTTASAAKHLGAPSEGRDGVLDMKTLPTPDLAIPENYTAIDTMALGASITNQVILAMEEMGSRLDAFDPDGVAFGMVSWAATLCYDTDLDSVMGIHNSFVAVFQDIMQHTGNPAVAVQSLLTMATANAYVELQPYFDFELPAQYSVWSRAQVPTGWAGFILVAATVAAHTVAVLVVVVLFRRQTRCTELGNSWQAVAQPLPDPAPLEGDKKPLPPKLNDAARAGKKEFKKRVGKEERDVRYRLVLRTGAALPIPRVLEPREREKKKEKKKGKNKGHPG